jgi:pyruvate dehydrogenase E2 component (dihydrolipoamide acetyltransferase)
MAAIELTVPDIGGFADIPVIEVLVAPGETIAKDAPLVTLESDKATMEIPATNAGVVKDVKVKVGDKVSQGSVIVTIESADAGAQGAAQAPSASARGSAQSASPVTAAASSDPVKNDPAGVVADAAGAAEEDKAPSSPVATGEPVETVVDLVVPDIGDFADIPVIEVLVAPGDKIAKDAALVSLESDKATMEVPASTGGVVREVKVKVGDRVSKGSVLASVSSDAPAPAAKPQQGAATASAAAAPSASAPTASAPAASGTSAPGGNGRPAAPANGVPLNGTPPSAAATAAPTGAPVHASPAIRRFARELGVELAHVRGSGPNGRITRDDVQAYVKTSLRTAPATDGAATAPAPAQTGLGLNLPPWPKVDFARFGEIERVPLSRIQKISGPVLARNWVMIPHVTQNDDADVTELEAFRKAVNGERKDVKVTMLAFLMKAALAALRRYPQLNASLDGDELVLKKYYHLGFAADTPNGLVVPVIKDVDRKGVIEIARETSELAAKARDGKLGPADMSGSTFTISSLGSIGGTYFTPIINAPEVAILGACKAEMRPVWDGSAFVPRLIQPLSLSYDHRVVDGALAARFTVETKNALADLRRTLL